MNQFNKLLGSIFGEEELKKIGKNAVLVLAYAILEKLRSKLTSEEFAVFQEFIFNNESEKAIELIKNKDINLKLLAEESKKEWIEHLGNKMSSVLEEFKNANN